MRLADSAAVIANQPAPESRVQGNRRPCPKFRFSWRHGLGQALGSRRIQMHAHAFSGAHRRGWNAHTALWIGPNSAV